MKKILFAFCAITLLMPLFVAPASGQTGWSVQASGTNVPLYDAYYTVIYGPAPYYAPIDTLRLCVGANGTILRKSTGEESWSLFQSSGWGNLRSIFFIYPDTGFIAGDNGLILRTNDRGRSWFPVSSPVGNNFNSMCGLKSPQVPNPNLMFIAGDSGVVLRSIDRGRNWVKRVTNTTRKLNAIALFSITEEFVCGDSGFFMKTTNAGTSWTHFTLDPQYDLYDISFVSSANGWIVGEGGVIYRTTTYGTVWMNDTSGVTQTLRTCAFLRDGSGYAAGDSGVIVKKRSGNAGWTKIPSGVTTTLRSIAFIDSLHGIAVGDDGTILETHTGGDALPYLSDIPDQVDFGIVPEGSFRTSKLSVYNNGMDTLEITQAYPTAPGFTIYPQSASILVGESFSFEIQFHPANKGKSYGSFVFLNNSISPFREVECSGEGVDSSFKSNWQWLNPKPHNTIFTGVEHLGDDNVITVSGEGTISLSHDDGRTWENVHAPSYYDNNINDVDFPTPLVGYAVGNFGAIIKTTDGGQHWFVLESNTIFPFSAVSFYDAMNGFVACTLLPYSSSVMLRTSDGGEHWVQQYQSTNYSIYAIAYYSPAKAIAAPLYKPDGRNNFFLQTSDGGNTWQQVFMDSTDMLFQVTFADSNNGSLVSYSGRVLTTSDGGEDWITTLRMPENAYSHSSIKQIDSLTIVVGQSGAGIWKTTNRGVSWNFSTLNEYFFDIDVSSNNIIAVGSGLSYQGPSLSVSEDGGVNWLSVVNRGTSQSLDEAQFLNENVGYALGDSGVVLKTTDGGAQWRRFFEGTIYAHAGGKFSGISFINEQTGMLVGSAGGIFYTTDGGEHWLIRNAGTPKAINDVILFNESEACMVGEAGIIYRTTNAGGSWSLSYSGTNQTLNSLVHIGGDTLLTAGNAGVVLISPDRGISWSARATNTSATLYDIAFLNAGTGYCIGSGGIILRTTNSGNNWTPVPNSYSENLYSISFYGEIHGIIAGEFGLILRTTNGGASWFRLNSPTSHALRGTCMLDENIVYVVGGGGTIIKSTTGGLLDVPRFTDEGAPSQFSLDQNYPNPFNPVTVIRYTLSVSSDVTLTIYDLLGREVATLVDGIQDAGLKMQTWDAGGFPSGVYFYRLQARSIRTGELMTQTRKLLLLK